MCAGAFGGGGVGGGIMMSLGARSVSTIQCTGWRRLIGSPKLQIIFHKRANKYRSLLRKTTYKDKGSYESSPPCTRSMSTMQCTLQCNPIYSHFVMYSHLQCTHTSNVLPLAMYCNVIQCTHTCNVLPLAMYSHLQCTAM